MYAERLLTWGFELYRYYAIDVQVELQQGFNEGVRCTRCVIIAT